MGNQPDITADHFEWLVEGRSRNQKATLALYRLLAEQEHVLNKNVELLRAAQEITVVAFSLWRAVFLSDTTGEFADQWADVRKFLVSLIADNTVLYITDKNARNWSFRFYLENATLRLDRLLKSDLKIVVEEDLSREAESDKDEWLNAQFAFEAALSRYQQLIRSETP